MNRLSRKKTRICIILTGVFIGIMVLSTLLQSRAIWGIGVLVGLCWGFLLDQTSRCPHCGRFFRGLSWSKPHAGYCRYCGKQMDYDDAAEA